MLSFSINKKISERDMLKVVDLINSGVKPDFMGAAYIKIVEGSDVRAEAQQEFMKRQERTANAVEVPVDEVYDSVMSKAVDYDFETEVQQQADLPWVVSQFHLLRFKLMVIAGVDIWRLLMLTQEGYKASESKLRAIVRKYDGILGIREVFTELLMTAGGLKMVKDDLGADFDMKMTPECGNFLNEYRKNPRQFGRTDWVRG